ncbi:MAG: TerC/Alx family metal homeostasis membrane protein [Clostridia bacterium]|nr:TerC/Alx family metal homeostasis membrane protein [Clostridia bacterium]
METGKDRTTEEGKTTSKGRKIWAEIWQYKWLYFWILMAAVFCAVMYFWQGASQAIDFASGYLIELSLSVDNLFVFLLIFISFGISEHAQHKVLNYGIAGTIVLRFVFIFLGISLINRFEWLLWVFGALLVFSGAKMFKPDDEDDDPRDGILYRIIAKFMPMSEDFEGEKFVVTNDGTNYDKKSLVSKKAKKLFTPLAVVMVLLIFSDIIFAIDSVPAVISMTRDMFIVYTSNMFAIMGLRQLFFLLEHMHEKFQYVRYGVAVILIFTGVKMLLDIFDIHIHNLISIAVILVILIASIIISVIVSKRAMKKDKADRMEQKVEIEEAFDEAEKEGKL